MYKRQHPALLVADVIASLGATPFRMDEWGVNVAIGASQKALMGPPGLSFTAVAARALQIARDNPAPRAYWDWNKRKSDLLYRKFCGTPPQGLLAGLRAALGLIAEEGEDCLLYTSRLYKRQAVTRSPTASVRRASRSTAACGVGTAAQAVTTLRGRA